jgi:hypothetical protein
MFETFYVKDYGAKEGQPCYYYHIFNEREVHNHISEETYSDIFPDMQKQIRAVKLWIFRIRKWKLEIRKLSTDGHQVHQLSASYTDNSIVTVETSPLDGDSATTVQNSIMNVYDFGP